MTATKSTSRHVHIQQKSSTTKKLLRKSCLNMWQCHVTANEKASIYIELGIRNKFGAGPISRNYVATHLLWFVLNSHVKVFAHWFSPRVLQLFHKLIFESGGFFPEWFAMLMPHPVIVCNKSVNPQPIVWPFQWPCSLTLPTFLGGQSTPLNSLNSF